MNLPIEKNIPIPAPSGRRARRYPFDNLEIGDSFLVPLEQGKSPSSIYSAISQARSKLKIELTSARVEGGIRIWRIAPSVPPQDGK